MFQSRVLSKYILPVILVTSALLGALHINLQQTGGSYDDAHYIILAESLSSGQGYQLINFPRPQIERAFPPGWPILLAPLTFLFPGNYTVLKLLTLILWLGCIPLLHRLFSKRVESPTLEILVGLAAVNPLLAGTSVTVMAESAYLFFSLVALVLFDSWRSKTEGVNNGMILLIGAAVLYAQLIRTVGIALFAALFIYLLFTRRLREAGIVFGIFMIGALLQAWLNLRNGGSMVSAGYESQVFNGSITEKIGQMGSNMLGYFNEVLSGSLIPVFGEKLTGLVGPSIPILLNMVIVLLILTGLVLSLKKPELPDVYCIVYFLAILAFWNPRVGSVKARFLIPILPFLYLYLILGSKWVLQKLTGGNPVSTTRLLGTAAWIILLVCLARNLQDWRNPVREQMTDLSIGTEWISRNAPPDAIIMVNEPVPAYLYTRRRTVSYPDQGQDIEKYLNNQGIDYIVVSPLLQSPRTTLLDGYSESKLLPFLRANPDQFTPVYSNSEYNVTVYEYAGQ